MSMCSGVPNKVDSGALYVNLYVFPPTSSERIVVQSVLFLLIFFYQSELLSYLLYYCR